MPVTPSAFQGVDVLVKGRVYADFVFSGLSDAPSPGHEVWADGFAASPGGVATKAVAAARLGARTALVAPLSDDTLGLACRSFFEAEDINLDGSTTISDWKTPITAALGYAGDRAFVTYELSPPGYVAPKAVDLPNARAIIAEVSDSRWWVDHAKSGAKVLVDAHEDASGKWDLGYLRERVAGATCFKANKDEALAYARTDCLDEALDRLADVAPLVVITLGRAGAIGTDATLGKRIRVEGIPVPVRDFTGAGDVFAAAFVVGLLQSWRLENSLRFAVAAAGISVQHLGGARSAPTLVDLRGWLASLHTTPQGRELAFHYGFLDHALPALVEGEDTNPIGKKEFL